MAIWFREVDIEGVRQIAQVNMTEHLGITVEQIGDDFIRGKMPVDNRTQQSLGMLHGGASVVLAESLGSIASNLVIEFGKYYAVGLEVNANHIRPVSSGHVHAIAKPVHLGRQTHVWTIEITNDDDEVVCISRLTMAVKESPLT